MGWADVEHEDQEIKRNVMSFGVVRGIRCGNCYCWRLSLITKQFPLIGKRNGVDILIGDKVHGLNASRLWRSYYLGSLPTAENKIRLMVDWIVDLFFIEERSMKANAKHTRNS